MNRHLLLLLLCFFLLPISESEGESLLFNSSYSPPYSTGESDGILERILAEAYARIGYETSFRQVPAERALLEANNGIADGVVARVPGIESTYPSLLFVPSATIPRRDFVAFTLDPDLEIGRWSDLSTLDVAIVRGWKIVEANVPGSSSTVRAESTEHAFRLLKRERTQVVINAGLDGLDMARRLGIDGVMVHDPPLASLSLYPYLHRRWSGLVPRLAGALDEMKADGTFEAIYEEAMAGSR